MPNLSQLNLPSNVPIPVKGAQAPQPLPTLPKPFSLNEEGRLPYMPDLSTVKMSLAQLGMMIKDKYPMYGDMDDEEVAKKIINKYPAYAERVALPEKEPGFLKSLGRAIVEPFARIAGNAKLALGGGIEKNQMTDEYGYDAGGNYVGTMKSSGVNFPGLGNFQPVGYDEGGQMKDGAGIATDLLGNSIQGGLMFAPATKGAAIGEAAIAKTLGKVAPKAAEKAIGFGSKLLPRALEAGTMGAGFQVGSNLSKERPLFENVGTAAALGAAFPVAGTALGAAGKKLISKSEPLRSGMAERLINSLIKPLGKDVAYGKNPGRGVAAEGIVAKDLEELAVKVTERRKQIGQAKGEVLMKPEYNAVRLDTSSALSPIDDAIASAKRMPNTNQALITRLEGIKADMQGIGVGQVQDLVNTDALKQEIGQLAKWTGNASDDKLVNMAVKQSYGKLKEQIEKIAPEIKPLNERFGDLLSAEIAAKHRDIIQQRLNLISLGGKTLGVGSSIIAAFATGGAAIPSILIGLGVTAIQGMLAKPIVRTKVAAWLAKSSNAEKAAVFAKVPALKNAIERVFGADEVAGSKLTGSKVLKSKATKLLPASSETKLLTAPKVNGSFKPDGSVLLEMPSQGIKKTLPAQEARELLKAGIIKKEGNKIIGGDNAFGLAAGIEPEYDENGKLKGYKFDAKKAMLGFAGITMGKKLLPKAKASSKEINSINPTGKIFTEYNPQERMMGTLAKNITTLDKTSGELPSKIITIYRGAPKTQISINPGDFITTNYNLAKDYAGTGHVIKKEVKISDVLDDMDEPLGEEYIYKPSK